jgi:hypothetical protein
MPRSRLRLRTFGAYFPRPPAEVDGRDFGGIYQVPGVDLVASCTGDYDPEGLLVWFPEERSFGVADTDHELILLFGPEVSWPRITRSPARYINAQWDFDDLERAPAKVLDPAGKYPQR